MNTYQVVHQYLRHMVLTRHMLVIKAWGWLLRTEFGDERERMMQNIYYRPFCGAVYEVLIHHKALFGHDVERLHKE